MSGYQLFDKDDFYELKQKTINELAALELDSFYNMQNINLLHFTVKSEEYHFLKNILEAGIDVNKKDYHGFNVIYHLYSSKNPYQILQLLLEHGLHIDHDEKYDLLFNIKPDLRFSTKQTISEFSQMQIFLLEQEAYFINRISQKEDFFDEQDIKTLASLLPDTINYLLKEKNIDVFSIVNRLGNNLISYIITEDEFNPYSNLDVFESLLMLMSYKQINHTNKNNENFLWQISDMYDSKISLLKKHNLDFNHRNNNGFGVLETHCKHAVKLAERLYEEGALLGKPIVIDLLQLSAEEVSHKYKIKDKNYDLFLRIAQKQYPDIEKEEIQNNLKHLPDQGKNKKMRL